MDQFQHQVQESAASASLLKAVIFGSELALHISGISDDLAAAGVTMLALGDLTSTLGCPRRDKRSREQFHRSRPRCGVHGDSQGLFCGIQARAAFFGAILLHLHFWHHQFAQGSQHLAVCSPTKIAHAYLRPGVDRNTAFCPIPLSWWHDGAGMMLCGITLIMRKFSARNFFLLRKYDATVLSILENCAAT